jgi:hypothetical protein
MGPIGQTFCTEFFAVHKCNTFAFVNIKRFSCQNMEFIPLNLFDPPRGMFEATT